MCQMKLRTITIIAEWYSLVFGLLCVGADLYYILLNTCTVSYPGDPPSYGDPSSFFHNQYIMGNECLINNSTRTWYECKENGISETIHYPGTRVTDPENIPYWFYTHFGLNVLWIVTILLLLTPTDESNQNEIDSKSNRNVGNAKADRIAANMLLPWILVTWIIIIFNIVAGVIFGLEIEFPMKAAQGDKCSFDGNFQLMYWLKATLILPLYFSLGVVFWIILLLIWVQVMLSRSRFYGKHQMKQNAKNNRNRNLSETPSNIIQTIENRFDRQERIENEEDKRSRNSREGSRADDMDGRNSPDDYVYKKQLRYHDAREQVISQEWSYANDGFEEELDKRPISLNRKASLKPESPELNERTHHQTSAAPISHMQDKRKISKSGSETSYRNSAKPPSTPPTIPKEDYPIPRAELSERRPKRRSESDMSDGFESGKEHIDKRKSRGKMMRTQSGRAVGATEYLKGYKPNQESLPE